MKTITAIKKPVFIIDVPTVGALKLRICDKLTFQRFMAGNYGKNDFKKIVIGKIPPMLKTIRFIAVQGYIEAVNEYIEDNMDALVMPYNVPEKSKCKFSVMTMEEHIASEYSGLSFTELNELDYIDYRLLCADAYKLLILKNQKDPEDYLNSCYAYMHDECIDLGGDDYERFSD